MDKDMYAQRRETWKERFIEKMRDLKRWRELERDGQTYQQEVETERKIKSKEMTKETDKDIPAKGRDLKRKEI